MTNQITPELIAEGRELAGKVELPWNEFHTDDGSEIRNIQGFGVVVDTHGDMSPANVDYACHAANNYPAAMDEIERLREENKQLHNRANMLELKLSAFIKFCNRLSEQWWKARTYHGEDARLKELMDTYLPMEIGEASCALRREQKVRPRNERAEQVPKS